tara:strand:+ start:384 stop:560 length:177 start_codon:yes stop_codon:yes gene_type:complete
VIQEKTYFHSTYRIHVIIDERLSKISIEKPSDLNMSQVENDLNNYYAVGNENTQRQEN